MGKIYSYINILLLFLILKVSYSRVDLIDISLNQTIKGSLSGKTYSYYCLVFQEDEVSDSHFLFIEARRNEEQDLLDNIFSDPNIYVSNYHSDPGPTRNEWSGNRFGDEVISINRIKSYDKKIFYISIYCEFKCNYILRANLIENHIMKPNVLYSVNMLPFDIMKLSFTSRKNYQKMKVNCISFKMRPFRIYLAKKDPSSTNTIQSTPFFINGYYFLIEKGDKNYGSRQEYNILIENKNYKQDLIFWISYDKDETKLNELSPLFGIADEDNENCYYFNIEKPKFNKNLIISTTLFNGHGYIKLGGWEKVKDTKIKFEDENAIQIVSDKSILLTEQKFKKFGNFSETDKSKNLHFCFIADQETSYSIKLYYQENVEKAQKLNYLLPGMGSDDILEEKKVTKYNLLYFEQNKDIKIELKIKKGTPKLYTFFTYEENNFINKTDLNKMIDEQKVIKSKQISYKTYSINIDKSDNQCLLEPRRLQNECNIYALIDCESNNDCIYELFFDHIGDIISMKPKVLYSNVISQNEIDKYEIHIIDKNVENFAVILIQNSGTTKLSLSKFHSQQGSLNFGGSEKYNKEYMPNIIEIKKNNFPGDNLIGTFIFAVKGAAFSSYEIYYYTFDDSSEQLDHKTVFMQLIKGKMIQDYIKLGHNIKVYSYDNSLSKKEKSDLFIYFNHDGYSDYSLYVFKSLDDYNYENKNVKGYIFKSGYYNYIQISKNDPNYIKENLYIMVFLNRYSDYITDDDNSIIYREKNFEVPFSLVITDKETPITLIKGVEYRHPFTSEKNKQIFYYNHFGKNSDFIMTINAPNTKVKLGVKIGEKDILYEKIVVDNYYVKIETKDINTYCPSENSCIIEITVESYSFFEGDFDVILVCKSSDNAIIHLNNNAFVDKRKIMNKEKQYYVFDANPLENYDIKINSISSQGMIKLYAKKANYSSTLDPVDFPNENNFEYSNINSLNKDEISNLNIPYKDLVSNLPCKILLTVEGALGPFYKLQGEYSISISNMIDDIFPNRNYKLMISKDEIKYYHFGIKGNKKRLSISMTNKKVDAYMYLNYGTMKNEISKFQWRSEGNYNEYIDISIDDSFFVSRKINTLDGEYYLAIRGFENTDFNLYISDLDIKIMTMSEEFPGVCQCEEEGDICYFRYENIHNVDIANLMKKELVFYFEFTYGSAQIYANLFQNGNNGEIIKRLPKINNNDYKSSFNDQYLKIALTPGEDKYTIDSVLILGAKCNAKSLFDFNVRPLLKSGDILKNDLGVVFLELNKDNVFYISELSPNPIKLVIYSNNNAPLIYEAKALSGSAEVHCYINTEEELWKNMLPSEDKKDSSKGYKHISKFGVDEKDISPYYDTIFPGDALGKNIVMEIKAKKDCLFSIFFRYQEKMSLIPISRQIQEKFENGKYYAYVELLKEYEEIIFSVEKMHSESMFSIYAKTSIVNNADINSKINLNIPSKNNYDVKGTTNILNPSLLIKIKNTHKDFYKQGKKVITIFYIEAENSKSFNDILNILVYPNVGNYELIHPKPNKYIYNSITHLKDDKTVFTLKKQSNTDNILVVEISSCQGNFGYLLYNSLNNIKSNNKDKDLSESKNQGKTTIVKKMGLNDEYYLSVYGLKEDEMIFNDNKTNSDIDFLIYYYTTNEEKFAKTIYDTKINYEIKSPGNVILSLPNLETINAKTNKNKLDDLTVSLIITENPREFNYLGSICFLSKKYEYIMKNKLYNNYIIEIDKKENKIEINKLNRKNTYYLNVLITNKKTGQIFAMEPVEIMPNKFFNNNIIVSILIISIVILLLVIFYFYRKYRIAKAIVNFENNDIKKMGSIPKSISELKKIQEEKNKKTKEKYNSLTEDSGEI